MNRAYRDSVRPQGDEVRFQAVVEETDLLLVAERDLQAEVVAFVAEVRGTIKSWLLVQPEFGESLTPVAVPDSAPEILRRMASAAEVCGVGPMAAVAGAVAQAVGERFAPESPNLLVENGGDVYLHSTRERVAALLAEPESGAMLGVVLPPDAFPVALCASSSTIGHSLSLGAGDLVAVRAKDARLADAAATHLCNLLKGRSHMDRVVDEAKRLAELGVEGVFAQLDADVMAWGDMELTALV